MAYTVRLKDKYKNEVIPALRERFGYKNPMQVPRVRKVVVNMGVGRATADKKILDEVAKDLTMLTGQKPSISKARISVSAFKVREGMPVGCFVTLRRERMYEFLDRLINIAIPAIKDFRGYPAKSFGKSGNFTIGITDQTIFPEVDSGKVNTFQGLSVTIVTSAKTPDEGRELLAGLGFPFRKN